MVEVRYYYDRHDNILLIRLRWHSNFRLEKSWSVEKFLSYYCGKVDDIARRTTNAALASEVAE